MEFLPISVKNPFKFQYLPYQCLQLNPGRYISNYGLE